MNEKIIKHLSSIIGKNKLTSQIAYNIARPEPFLNTVSSRTPLGTNVYNCDWDLLVILDTCRVDALRIVADEYNFLNEVGGIWSVASSSREWMQKTFVEEYNDEIEDTLYVTANPWAQRVLSEKEYMTRGWPNWDTVSSDTIGLIDHVWKVREEQSAAAHPEDTSAPELVTDRAISHGRQGDFERMIVHYVPPHHSYVANALDGRPLKRYEKNPFECLREGHDLEPIWEAYLNELRWVLEWVEILLSNINAPKTVISSDHGEAFGEYGLYMHDPALLDPNVKRVPWAQTTAIDKQTREPDQNNLVEMSEVPVETEDQLRAMGYL